MMCLWNIWKGLGWGAIMYLAGISGIDPELYESARIDGANRFHLMRHITLPALMPTFLVMLMLSIANLLNNGMDQYFVFQNAFNRNTIQVLDLYVYNLGMGGKSIASDRDQYAKKCHFCCLVSHRQYCFEKFGDIHYLEEGGYQWNYRLVKRKRRKSTQT